MTYSRPEEVEEQGGTPGWIDGAPPLAVEYADTGQDVKDLRTKISELLAAGTKIVWVVRLTGPRRVEIYEAGKEMRLAHRGEELAAPGILQNPVPVEALYDREAAHEVTFRNLLQRQGYRDLDDVQAKALRDAVFAVLNARGLRVDDTIRTTLEDCRDPETLQRWLTRAATAESSDEVLSSQS